MSNSVAYKDLNLAVGDTVSVSYRLKDGDKERLQLFKGILLKIKGTDKLDKRITVRKISKSGIGVERIFPIVSPQIAGITLDKKSTFTKAKLYFVRNLSDSELRKKLYRKKK